MQSTHHAAPEDPHSRIECGTSPGTLSQERGSGLLALCAAAVLTVAVAVGCGGGSDPTPTPDTPGADFFACFETCVAKGGSDSQCRTFCEGGSVESPAKDEARVSSEDAEGCYEACIAKGGSGEACRGFCEEKPGLVGKPAGDVGEYLTFEHDGVTRRYLYHAPADLPANAPLVFFLHGHGGNAGETRAWVGLDRVADANGFAVAYPQGSGDYSGTPYWNARAFPGVVDDVGFLSALARSLQSAHGLDRERTFAAGFSNGGMMSYVLAMDAPDVFRGAASVVGTMAGDAWGDRDSSTATFPLLQISGLDDAVVPFGGSVDPTGGPGAPSMEDLIAYWSARNACSSVETDALNANTTRVRHVGCADGNEVWHYAIDDFGHEWPTVGGSAGFDGAEAVWGFFGGF